MNKFDRVKLLGRADHATGNEVMGVVLKPGEVVSFVNLNCGCSGCFPNEILELMDGENDG